MKRENVSTTRDSISPETTHEWVERAKALKPLLEAAAPRIEQTKTLPPDVIDALHNAQMFRTVLPRSVGGAELNPATIAQVVAAIAEGDASAAWCMAQSACASMAAAYVDPKVAQEIWANRRALFTFGFTSGNPPCLAVPVKGGWKINGTWTFGSGSRVATYLGGHCRLCDESGTPLRHPDGRFVERTMLIPRSSVTIVDDTWDVMGLCGTGSDTYAVSDLFVPTEYSVVPRVSARDHQLPEGVRAEPEPERREKGILYRHSMQLVASAALSSVAVGVAQATLDAFIPLAKKKSPFNANQSLREDTWIQTRLAQADSKLASAKGWLIQLLHQAWDECVTSGEVSFPLRIKLRQACTHQIDAAREVVTMLFLEAGATAIFRSNPFERRFRDVHTISIQVQGSVARMQAAGQYYLGLSPQQMILIP